MESQVITIEVEFLTDSYRIIGNLPTGERRLSDILNFPLEDSVVLDNVSTTPIDDPEAAPLVRGFAQINKETIAFGVPHEPPTTVDERRKIRPFEYVAKNRHQVLISLPPFAITGYLHLVQEADIRTALSNLTQKFVPISEAQTAYLPNPRIKWSNQVIIINRAGPNILATEEPVISTPHCSSAWLERTPR